MSGGNRRPYQTFIGAMDQDFLNECQDNLSNQLELIVDIAAPDNATIIHASDRNKYYNDLFYEALVNFPTITRTVGDWLVDEVEFPNLTIEVSNADGRFNRFMPGGANFGSWIGKEITVKLGLRDNTASYTTIFRGFITDEGGFKRGVKSFTLIARDQYDKLNQNFPTIVFGSTAYPLIQESVRSLFIPVIYGDWTVNVTKNKASVPAFILNGEDPLVNTKERNVTITGPASPGVFTVANHGFQANDAIELGTSGTLPTPLAITTVYYIKTVLSANTFTISTTPAGAAINTSSAGAGDHTIFAHSTAVLRDIDFRISENDLELFDSTNVYLVRNDVYYQIPSSEVYSVGAGNKTFKVKQKTGVLWLESAAYIFEESDLFYVRVKGKNLGAYDDNLISQARDILVTYGGAIDVSDFDTSWDTYRDKSTPAQSAISIFKSRVWVQEQQPALKYALSMLEQVRLEAFIDRNLNIKINSLHFEDWPASPAFRVTNFDIARESFTPVTDDSNNFNRAKALYNFLPNLNGTSDGTNIYKNSAAITAFGKTISKQIVFPNLYENTTATYQLQEVLKLASAAFEIAECTLTWRALLLDVGDFVKVNVQIGAAMFEDVPCMIRQISYDPQGIKLPVKLWSTQLIPFPGYAGVTGATGGYAATMTLDS